MTNHQIIFGRAVHKVIEEYYKSLMVANYSRMSQMEFGKFGKNSGRLEIDKEKNDNGLSIDDLIKVFKEHYFPNQIYIILT